MGVRGRLQTGGLTPTVQFSQFWTLSSASFLLAPRKSSSINRGASPPIGAAWRVTKTWIGSFLVGRHG